jgi:DNA-binding NarL/FixJ family response regulator
MAYANRIRILVLHADPIARAGLSSTFGRYSDLEVVSNTDEADDEGWSLPLPISCSADVVVADYESGVELATKGSRRPGTGDSFKIMVVASSDREWEIRSALERGVRGYVLVGCALDELACGVRAVHRGARHLSPQVAQRLAESMSGEPLTAREEQVLRLVVEGMGNKAIARRLDIAVGTVKSHLKGVFDKLNVVSRTQAICAAERRGLLRELSQRMDAADIAKPTAPTRPHLHSGQTIELRAVVSS